MGLDEREAAKPASEVARSLKGGVCPGLFALFLRLVRVHAGYEHLMHSTAQQSMMRVKDGGDCLSYSTVLYHSTLYRHTHSEVRYWMIPQYVQLLLSIILYTPIRALSPLLFPIILVLLCRPKNLDKSPARYMPRPYFGCETTLKEREMLDVVNGRVRASGDQVSQRTLIVQFHMMWSQRL